MKRSPCRLFLCSILVGACAADGPSDDAVRVDGPGTPLVVTRSGASLDGAPRLATVSWGREDSQRDTVDAPPRKGGCYAGPGGRLTPTTCEPTVERELPGALEQFRRVGEGVGQTWDLAVRPAGAGPVVIRVSIDAGEGSVLTAEGDDVAITTPTGQRYRYAGLRAWDARGVELPSWMSIDGVQVRLAVDDAEATYPVHVDPVLSTASRTLSEASTDYGIAVALRGDVNNNGYADLMVGARFGTGLYGEAFSYHGSASGILSTYARKLSGPDYYGKFGEYLDNGGDVNGDGYDDVVVSEFYSERVTVYHGSATGIGATAATTIIGPYGFGRGVAYVGDMNNDGYDEVAFGSQDPNFQIHRGSSAGLVTTAQYAVATISSPSVAPGGDTNSDGYDDAVYGVDASNAMYVVRGGASIPGTITALTRAGSVSLGFAVAGGGDINGDGFDDVLGGDPNFSSGTGRVVVYLGASTGVTSARYQVLASPTTGSEFGSSLAVIGDVNADGFDDVAVGDGFSFDKVYVFHGSATGLVATPVNTLSVGNNNFGYALSGGGDANGDGYGDLAVGTIGGSVYIYNGCADGDNDGQCAGVDCNDSDATIRVGATEVVGDGIDQDCSGAEVCYVNADGDGFRISATVASGDVDCSDAGEALATRPAGDCDDGNAGTNPGAVEVVADGVDQNCDGAETCYVDADGDGFRISATVASGDVDCSDAGEALATQPAGDCDDGSAGTNPGAVEIVGDEVDQDCSGAEVCYVDADGDGFRISATVASGDVDCGDAGEARATRPRGDCDDGSAGTNPGAVEIVGDEIDQDCSGAEVCYVNADGDGFRISSTVASGDVDCNDPGEALATRPAGDCDDGNAGVNPSAVEVVADGVDQDCNGAETCYVDADGDAFRISTTVASGDVDCTDAGEALATQPAGDCDDGSAGTNPGAVEVVADGVDQDCSGTETCHVDADGDAFRLFTTVGSADADCDDAGEALAAVPAGDCDDGDATVNPGASEVVADGIDQDCNSTETCYVDADGDAFRLFTTVGSADADCDDAGEALAAVPAGDCDDGDATVNPGASEVVADGIDQDCNGAETCYVDGDDDGYRLESTANSGDVDCDDAGEAFAAAPVGDCDDADAEVNPAAGELAGDGVDQDCDGAEVCLVDGDGDGYRTDDTVASSDVDCEDLGEAGAAMAAGDCADAAAQVNPGAEELAGDGVDQNCDGAEICFVDGDDDGFRTTATVASVDADCADAGEAAAAEPAGDCDDGDALVQPGREEILDDGIDQDCDGQDAVGDDDVQISGGSCSVGGSTRGSSEGFVLSCIALLLGAGRRRRKPMRPAA